MKAPAILALAALASAAVAFPGADVAYQDSISYANYGVEGNIRAYYLASYTCNLGDTTLSWVNQGTPVLFAEMFRLSNGKLEQIGLGWGKYACCAASGSGCPATCNSGAAGSGLKPGCRDSYGATYNGTQSRLGPRSGVNPWTGAVGPVPGGTNTAITRRLQVKQTDLTTPGARYFIQGTYVATDDASSRNHYNNSSYKPITINQSTFDMVTDAAASTMALGRPAIYAWRDHGLGTNQVDPSVTVVSADVPNEGRFYAAAKVTDLGNGTYHYEYAVQNLNSDRAGGSFMVLVPAEANVTNIGFHDVDYHSGEPYDNTDWTAARRSVAVIWSSPQTFDQNPNSNALRFGTMYNFSFDANVAPAAQLGSVELGLFKPHTPQVISISGLPVPAGFGCVADLAGGPCACADCRCPNGAVNIDDLVFFLRHFERGILDVDLDDDGDPSTGHSDGAVTIDDLVYFLNKYEAGC